MKTEHRASSQPSIASSNKPITKQNGCDFPTNSDEALLCEIWADVLKLTPIGIHDNFFELGGHSLLVAQVLARIQDLWSATLSYRTFFATPTVAQLAKCLANSTSDASVSPIERIARTTVLPLSFAQHRMWFIEQLHPNSALNNVSCAFRLEGYLHINALEQALNELLKRHETLRTNFRLVAGEPIQVISPDLTISLRILQGVSEAELQMQLDLEAKTPFDLGIEPLIRNRLLCLSAEVFVFQFTIHHIVFDGWSEELLMRELSVLYSGALQNIHSVLPELPIQYADYSAWQTRMLKGAVLEKLCLYWKKQLHNLPVMELPTDRPRPATQSYRGACIEFHLPTALVASLKQLSRMNDATLFMTLLTAFQVLLHRYTAQQDIVVGSLIAGRNRNEIAGLIGFFVNTLVLRVDVSTNPDFLELLAMTREMVLDAFNHADLPFDKLVNLLAPQRNLSHHPLFQIMFVLQLPLENTLALEGLKVMPTSVESKSAKFDLMMSLTEVSGSIKGIIEYSTDLFDAQTLHRMAEHFQTLLEGIVSTPLASISKLPLITDADRARLRVEWNNTAQTFPQSLGIHQLFEVQAAKTPGSAALTKDGITLSYAELNARANQLARYLRKLGVTRDTLVALAIERSFEMIVGILGILKAGGAYLALDPEYPLDRLSFMLADSCALILLTQQSLSARLPQQMPHTVYIDQEWPIIARLPITNPDYPFTPEQLAYLIYTSGSTGIPKGVMMPHAPLCNLLYWQLQNTPGIKVDTLQYTTLSFDVSFQEIFSTLTAGACLFLIDNDIRLDSHLLLKWIDAHKIARLFLPYVALTALCEAAVRNSLFPKKLRYVITAGEALKITPNIRELFKKTHASLHNHYGPSESHVVTAYDLGLDVNHWPTLPSIGRPIGGCVIYILDRHRQPLPTGIPGEIYIGGDCLARGYHNRPELTAEKFIGDPFINQSGARLYQTGDRARYLADGTIQFLGRFDHQVKIRGFRIELGEIESVLRQFPAVQDAAVTVDLSRSMQHRLIAYVSAKHDTSLSPAVLRKFLSQQLPDYMLPSAYVILESLPLTPSGKTDRQALPAPTQENFQSADQFVAASTPAERILCELFAEVLEIKEIGIHDNFFELGGHSILAAQVVARIRDRFKCALSLRNFFELPTVSLLTGILNIPDTSPVRLLPACRKEIIPLSFSQQRLWFLEQLLHGSALYNLAYAFELTGRLNISALERSINEILQRHEALRTTFKMIDAAPAQVISKAKPCALTILRMHGCNQAALHQQLHREASAPFNLHEGPLFCSRLILLDEQQYILLFTVHHIVFDGESLPVLLHELAVLYAAYTRNRLSPLPELPIQYADFAVSQKQWLQDKIFYQQLDYWKKQLDALPIIELFTDHPRPAVPSYRGALFKFLLPATISSALAQLGKKSGATLFMTLLSAFKVLLHRYSAQLDIVVGTSIAGRNPSELAGLIGFFVNTLVLRTDLSGNPSFVELLSRVREMALDAYSHADLPFDQLVSELAPQRSLNHHPLFQIMFVLQNTNDDAWTLDGLSCNPIPLDLNTAKFDLTLSMTEFPEGISGMFEYSTDLFDATTIHRMALHFQTLLESIVNHPHISIGELPLLSKNEREEIIGNSTPFSLSDSCVHQLFETQRALTPDAIAVIYESQQLSYRELDYRANQLAHYLRGLGVCEDSLVAICMTRSIEMVVSLMGVLKAGGAYLPLDAEYPLERLSFMISDSAASVVLTQTSLLNRLPPARLICVDAEWPKIMLQPAHQPVTQVLPYHLAYLIYTSGSSGLPKGVAIEHRSIVNHCRAICEYFQLSPTDRILQFSSFSFDASVEQILPPLSIGATVVLARHQLKDPVEFDSSIRNHRVTLFHIPPAFFQLWLMGSIYPLPESLRLVNVGGDTLTPESVAAWYALPENRVKLVNTYGPTETTVTATVYTIPRSLVYGSIPIGRPLPDTRLYILDRYLQPVPIGVAGELHIGGIRVGRGYLHRPELTTERFIPDPFSATGRLYKTGDLVRQAPDGNIIFLGRIDQQVKIRGFRIELGEIESVLKTFAAVQEAIVLARVDHPGDKRLVAYLTTRPNMSITPGVLRDFLLKKLPDHMVPSAYMLLDSLPLTPNGKLNRKALPAPHTLNLESIKKHTPPYNTLQAMLVQIWTELLSTPNIGIHDNFFESGGDSLKLVVMSYRLQQRTGCSLPLDYMYANPTIALLASAMLEYAGNDHQSALIKIQSGSSMPPFFFMHGDFHGGGYFCHALAKSMGADQPFYAIQPHGLPGLPLPGTVEEMASANLALIRAVHPGPYFLAGHCIGALVAFEMAQQLQSSGAEVGLLIMMSPPMARLVNSPSKLPDLPGLPEFDTLSVEARHNAVIRLYKQSYQQYRPNCFRGKLTLFMPKDDLDTVHPDRGWKKMATTGEIHVQPGNHLSMITDYGTALAQQLMKCKKRVKWD